MSVLSIKGLHASVDDREILCGLDLEVDAGEVHAIMGPNGSGKSTLSYVLAGRESYEVTAGTVTYLGHNLLAMETEERAAQGVFLAMQYPVEIPGISNITFLKTAVNALRRARGDDELDAIDFLKLAREKGRQILPVDSEHSAIFQSLLAGTNEEVERIILTASGGPFRKTSLEDLQQVTREDALNHPTWEMGEKITIDSATLMNKALEIIEARWLFELPPEKIEVVVHPQSIIHSLVEYRDGSTICQLGPPDMRIPIQYALTYPHRLPLPTKQVNLAELGQLTFEAPDLERFPALRLAY